MPKIKNIITSRSRPISVEFQNGRIQPENYNTLKSKLFENEEKQKLLGIRNKKAIYVGAAEPDEFFNHYLICYKEGQKKLDLIQMDTCILAPFTKKTNADLVSTNHTVADLYRQFGSKKTKRYTEQRERLEANMKNVKEHLEKTLRDIDITDAKNIPETCPESEYVPKINRNASSKEDVYYLGDLVPTDILNSLQTKAAEISATKDLSSLGLIQTVEKAIVALRILSLAENVLLEKLKALVYLQYLLSFINTPIKKITKQYVCCDCSTEVNKHIRENYLINGTRPASIKDKAICYAMTILMLTMDYHIDLEPFSKDIRTSLTRLKTLARNLGFAQSNQLKTGVLLKIPLPAPTSFTFKRKK